MSKSKYHISEFDTLNKQLKAVRKAVRYGNIEDGSLFEIPGGQLGLVRERRGEWSCLALNDDALNAHLMGWCIPVGPSGPKTKLSTQLVRAYMGTEDWDGVPFVSRLTEAPVVRPDLSIAWNSGYDAPSQTYVTHAMKEPDVLKREDVSQTAAEAAAVFLLSWFDPFALENQESRADALALALTPMLMSYIPTATIPGGVAVATKPGSGKTKLCELIAYMGTREQIKPTSWPKQSEMKKDITTYLSGAPGVVLFDNVKTEMDDDSLESVLTSRWWKDRRFHTQTSLTLPNNTLWLFTKNSPEVSPDMLRRLIIIPLDVSKTVAQWNPRIMQEAVEQREHIATAMVMLILNWARLGAPKGSVSLSGYEVWSETVSGILEAAGVEGFNQARAGAVENVYTSADDESSVVERIARVMGESVWTASDLWDTVNSLESWGDQVNADKAALRKWLDSGAKEPVMAVGRKIATLRGKQFQGCPYSVERLEGQKARFRVLTTTTSVSVSSLLPINSSNVIEK